MSAHILYPILTEKSSRLQGDKNIYSFAVRMKANKEQIKKEVESLKKNIKVESVNTLIVRGKEKRVGASKGKRSNWKKAIVKLQDGQTLDLVESA